MATTMKKLLIVSTLIAFSGAAESKTPVEGHVEDVYVNEVISVPTQRRMCYDVPVPIYERQQSGNWWNVWC